MTARLAWIGLGRQGEPMARKLRAAGHDLAVWARDRTSLSGLAAMGAHVAASPCEAAHEADGVFLCLPGDAAVRSVLFANDGVLAGARAGAIIIDHSSILPATAAELAQRAADGKARVDMLDAPVSGGPAAAEAAAMVVWAGGSAEAFAAARPWMASYAAHIHHMGPSGSGQTTKACHQVVACGNVALWYEALRLAGGTGLDPERLAEAMEGAAADSLVRRTFAAGLAAGAFPARSHANMVKDLTNARDLAEAHGVSLPMSRSALDQFWTQIAALVPAG